MFELKITEPRMPESITWNYEELKGELTEALSDYEKRIYTEDTIAEAKSDKASLNKLKKTINDERIRREKEYMKPFETFKAQVKEICGLIDGASEKISDQIEGFEEKQKSEKKEKIVKLFEEKKAGVVDWLSIDKIFNEKWLNKSISMKSIDDDISQLLTKITSDLQTIKTLEAYSFEATDYYKRTLDLNGAIAEGQRLIDLQKRKEAEKEKELQRQITLSEAQKQLELGVQPEATIAETVAEELIVSEKVSEPEYTFKFKATLTKTQAIALSQFCKENKIKLIQIKED